MELARVSNQLPDDDQGREARALLEEYLSGREVDAVRAVNVALDSRRYRWMVNI